MSLSHMATTVGVVRRIAPTVYKTAVDQVYPPAVSIIGLGRKSDLLTRPENVGRACVDVLARRAGVSWQSQPHDNVPHDVASIDCDRFCNVVNPVASVTGECSSKEPLVNLVRFHDDSFVDTLVKRYRELVPPQPTLLVYGDDSIPFHNAVIRHEPDETHPRLCIGTGGFNHVRFVEQELRQHVLPTSWLLMFYWLKQVRSA